MNRKLWLILSGLIALPVVVFAYTDCRDIDKPDACSVEQLVQISDQTHLTMEDRISALKMAVKMLTDKLAALNNPTTSCLDLKNDLWIGKTDSMTNGEVTKLQRFLGVQPTGYYGNLTAEAAMKWQKAHGMDFVTLRSGVGLLTRGKMRCGLQNDARVRWTIGAKVDDNFNSASVTITLPDGSLKTANITVRNDCKELNQQNMDDEYLKKVGAGAVFEKTPNVIKPGLACVSWDNFAWYGVFLENGKYYVKQLADDASGLGTQTWKILKEI